MCGKSKVELYEKALKYECRKFFVENFHYTKECNSISFSVEKNMCVCVRARVNVCERVCSCVRVFMCVSEASSRNGCPEPRCVLTVTVHLSTATSLPNLTKIHSRTATLILSRKRKRRVTGRTERDKQFSLRHLTLSWR
jgi:hypothetical protein